MEHADRAVDGVMPIRRVAVICTVLNEAATIRELLRSLAEQTRQPDEILIVDGGSTDGTLDILEASRATQPFLQVIRAPGCNISEGRNRAIAASDAQIIASTDAGVRLSSVWLEQVVAPFDADPSLDVVSGFFEPDARSTFEMALGATTLPSLEEIDHRFLPSSRSVAFTRQVWERVGGYPEWLDYCEDVVFDVAIKASGGQFALAPRALVYFRPRPTLAAFLRQYYLYARGDGKAYLWPRRHAIRYTSYLCGALAILLGFWYKGAWLVLLLAGLAYLHRPYRRLLPRMRGLGPVNGMMALGLVPVIRLAGDGAKMVGYPAGILWRWRRGKVLGGRP